MGLLKKAPKPEEAYNAVKQNNAASLSELVAKKCDVMGYKDQFTGDVCLHVAANKGRDEIVEILISHNAEVNYQNKIGQTALHCAAGYGYLKVVRRLLAAGANTALQDLDGNTAIDLAKNYANCPEMVELLSST